MTNSFRLTLEGIGVVAICALSWRVLNPLSRHEKAVPSGVPGYRSCDERPTHLLDYERRQADVPATEARNNDDLNAEDGSASRSTSRQTADEVIDAEIAQVFKRLREFDLDVPYDTTLTMFGSLCKLFDRGDAAKLVALYCEIEDYMNKTGHGHEERLAALGLPFPPKMPHPLDGQIANGGGDPITYGRMMIRRIVGERGHQKLMENCSPPSDERPGYCPDIVIVGWYKYR